MVKSGQEDVGICQRRRLIRNEFGDRLGATRFLSGECSDAYTPCVLEAEDRNCSDIGFRVTRTGYADPYGLDRDGDGFGCESYPEEPDGEASKRAPA